MISICIYFQVHQPFRLKKNYSFFDIGKQHDYEDESENRAVMRKVAKKCYLPANALMLKLIHRFQGDFKVSYSISGMCLEGFERYCPEVIDSFKALTDTGCVELINETYYHSLAYLYSKKEFRAQVRAHKDKLKSLFGVTSKTFRNTELIYNNELAKDVEKMGYRVILAEGAEHVLGWRSPNFVYQPEPSDKLKLLLKNYRLSDDIAFRFSNPDWSGYPLTAEKFANWVHEIAGTGEVLNLFMDYETIGEHQWASTGIFEFIEALPNLILQHPDFIFHTPQETVLAHQPMAKIDVPYFTSWADLERDTTAWLGNQMQNSAIEYAYELEKPVMKSHNPQLIHTWRKLLTSDHFYYMCTKWFSDGDVHKYFNPFSTPYDAYIAYVNVLNDLRETLKQ